jgi:hypothetical protein
MSQSNSALSFVRVAELSSPVPLGSAEVEAFQDGVEMLLHRELLWEMDALADELDEGVEQIDEVSLLTWALLDQTASPENLRRLSSLLLQDKQARAIYVQCVDLHAELEQFCAPSRACR